MILMSVMPARIIKVTGSIFQLIHVPTFRFARQG